MAPDERDGRRLFESVVERRIREAAERGDFTNLPGAGKPLGDLGDQYDPAWWAKTWVRRQRLEAEAQDLREERRTVRPKAAIDPAMTRRLGEIDDRLAEIEREIGPSGAGATTER